MIEQRRKATGVVDRKTGRDRDRDRERWRERQTER